MEGWRRVRERASASAPHRARQSWVPVPGLRHDRVPCAAAGSAVPARLMVRAADVTGVLAPRARGKDWACEILRY